MDVRNCKMCGAIFNFDGSPLCPKCRRKMEEKFSVVKEYILKNPSSSISVISEETEVPIQQLKRWIREERLSFSKESGVVIQCEKCGAPILTGRFCKECKRTMTRSLRIYTAVLRAAMNQRGPRRMQECVFSTNKK